VDNTSKNRTALKTNASYELEERVARGMVFWDRTVARERLPVGRWYSEMRAKAGTR
jgi:hypothetical protein